MENDASIPTNSGDRAASLRQVLQKKYEQIAKILIDHGAQLNVYNDDGCSALICAAGEGFVEIARILIAGGATIDATQEDSPTALTQAAMFGRVEVAELLINHGADVNTISGAGITVLEVVSNDVEGCVLQCLLEDDAFMPLKMALLRSHSA